MEMKHMTNNTTLYTLKEICRYTQLYTQGNAHFLQLEKFETQEYLEKFHNLKL